MKKGIFFAVLMMILSTVIFKANFVCAQESKDEKTEYEKQLRERLDAAEKIAREKLDDLYNSANSTDSADKRNIKGFVLSTEVRTFKDVPENVDKEISIIKENIRSLIFQVATDIETSGGCSGKMSVGVKGISYELPADAIKEYKDFMQAKEKNNVSLRSIYLAIQLLASINGQLMAEAKEADDVQAKRKLYITQAVYIYEMADIVLDVLNKVSLEGKATLEKIKSQNENRINTRIHDMKSELERIREEKANGKLIEKEAAGLEKIYSNLIAANKESLKGWDYVMKVVGNQEEWLAKMKERKTSIMRKRNAAKHQLDTLRDIVVVGEIMSIVSEMDELVATIRDIPLLELDPETVQELLFGKPVIKDGKPEKSIIIN